MTGSTTGRYLAHAALALVVAAVVALAALAATGTEASAVSSDHGASFAVRCDFSHRLSDDPIVHPGMPGMAHSHDFFGNTTTDAYSTYASLRAGGTTCTRFEEDTAAYWLPTVSWDGTPLDSNRAVFYYRTGGKNYEKVKPFPAKLKIIAGNPEHVYWRCGRLDDGGGSQSPPTQCDSGELGVRVVFPDCLAVDRKGKPRLDSADHRSHMAYSRPVAGGWDRCPRSRPMPVPSLTVNATYPIPTTPGEVTLSSGDASTMHADFFNAWNQEALRRLVVHCINKVPPWEPRPEKCQSPRL